MMKKTGSQKSRWTVPLTIQSESKRFKGCLSFKTKLLKVQGYLNSTARQLKKMHYTFYFISFLYYVINIIKSLFYYPTNVLVVEI